MAHLTYLIIFHLKMIVCQNVNLPHTYGHDPKTTHLWYDNYQIIHMTPKLIPMEWQCLGDATNFMKI
jgi:hypothetical protein